MELYSQDSLVDIMETEEPPSQSDRLRETLTNNPIASRISKDGERRVRKAAIQAVARLKFNYPYLKLTHRVEPNIYCRCGCNETLVTQTKTAKHSDGHCRAGCGKNNIGKAKFCSPNCKMKGEYLSPTELLRSEINKKLSIDFGNSDLEKVRYGGSGISPDGGIVFLFLPKTNIQLIVGVVEHKYQGTNDKRKLEGKEKQQQGNAFERAYKNWHVVANYMRGENITPYIVYVHGCDFEDPSSTIPDRATSMTNNNPFNTDLTINTIDIYGEVARRGSVFELWKLTDDQLINSIYQMYETSIKYYLDKYVGEFDVASK